MAAKEKINLLDVIPCRSEHITVEREGETIVLSFPRFKYTWMQRFLVPKGMSKELHVHLEEHGTVVWELIDGKQTVREIIEKLAVHFQNEAGYESRVSTYLYQLQKDGFIKFPHRVTQCLTESSLYGKIKRLCVTLRGINYLIKIAHSITALAIRTPMIISVPHTK